MPISYSCEAENGVVTSVFPNPDAYTPHIAVSVANLAGVGGIPQVIVSRLSPDDARAIGVQLQHCADRVQLKWDAREAEASVADEDLLVGDAYFEGDDA
jgi:hypothetical protein